MVFLRSHGSHDLINFVGTKKRISPSDTLQHFGFKTTKAGLTSLEKKLKENETSMVDAADTRSISAIPTGTLSNTTATRSCAASFAHHKWLRSKDLKIQFQKDLVGKSPGA